jgi:hypothetical protein
MLGVRCREILHGGFYLLSDPVDERPADLFLDVDIPDVTNVARSRLARLRGTIRLEGFADDPRAAGKLIVNREQRRLAYDLRFGALDGTRHRFWGYRQLELLDPIDSATLIRASLYDGDAHEIGRAMLRFDLRGGWKALLRSFRVRVW